MNLEEIIQWVIIGIITGMFSTFAPALFAWGFDVIMSLINKAS